MRNQWTRERIIRHLLDRQARGQSLTVGGQGVELPMYNAARRIFGSWRNAILAAGIAPGRVLTWERWTPARILAVIRQLAQRRRPVTVDQMERRYDNIVSAARRHFGSWGKAVVASGVDPTRLQRVVPWTRERVIESILTRALRGESLAARLVDPRSLVEAGQRFFGGWAAAVAAAGLDTKLTDSPARRRKRSEAHTEGQPLPSGLDQPRQPWNRDRVIAAIHDRVRNGQELSARAVNRDDGSLYRAGHRHLKSWCNALREAGLNPADHRINPPRKARRHQGYATERSSQVSHQNGDLRPDRPA